MLKRSCCLNFFINEYNDLELYDFASLLFLYFAHLRIICALVA